MSCIARRVASELLSMPRLATGVCEAGDRLWAYKALAERWHDACSAWVLDCVGPTKDLGCICVNGMLLISLLASPKIECFCIGFKRDGMPVKNGW